MSGPLKRIGTAGFLLPVFLLFGAGDAFSVHVCPHHGLGEAPHAHAEAHEHGAGGGEHAPSDADHGAGSTDEADHEGPCTCPGTCHADEPVGAAIFVTWTDLGLRAPSMLVPDRTSDVRPLRTTTPHVLPFSTAPPTG